MTKENNVILTARDIVVEFDVRDKVLTAIRGVSLDLIEGEVLALVGESGSGKTTIGRAIIGLNDTSAGDILYEGKKINGKQSKADEAELIRKIQMIFQDPAASLNERATVDYIISEGLYNYHLFENEEDRQEFLVTFEDQKALENYLKPKWNRWRIDSNSVYLELDDQMLNEIEAKTHEDQLKFCDQKIAKAKLDMKFAADELKKFEDLKRRIDE